MKKGVITSVHKKKEADHNKVAYHLFINLKSNTMKKTAQR